jgi:hypothetical protein
MTTVLTHSRAIWSDSSGVCWLHLFHDKFLSKRRQFHAASAFCLIQGPYSSPRLLSRTKTPSPRANSDAFRRGIVGGEEPGETILADSGKFFGVLCQPADAAANLLPQFRIHIRKLSANPIGEILIRRRDRLLGEGRAGRKHARDQNGFSPTSFPQEPDKKNGRGTAFLSISERGAFC